jgi:hypothetical protein
MSSMMMLTVLIGVRFALGLIGNIMFPDKSRDSVPSFILPILMIIL